MLRKKWQVKVLTLVLASSLAVQDAAAMDWTPLQEMLSHSPGEVAQYLGLSQFLSNFAPSQWGRHELCSKKNSYWCN